MDEERKLRDWVEGQVPSEEPASAPQSEVFSFDDDEMAPSAVFGLDDDDEGVPLPGSGVFRLSDEEMDTAAEPTLDQLTARHAQVEATRPPEPEPISRDNLFQESADLDAIDTEGQDEDFFDGPTQVRKVQTISGGDLSALRASDEEIAEAEAQVARRRAGEDAEPEDRAAKRPPRRRTSTGAEIVIAVPEGDGAPQIHHQPADLSLSPDEAEAESPEQGGSSTPQLSEPVEPATVEPAGDITAEAPSEVDKVPEERRLEGPARIHLRNVVDISPDRRLVMMRRPNSDTAEQFRVLALKLQDDPGVRVIAVAVPSEQGEGSVLAANLALAMTEGNRCRVCLVDANLRQGEVAGLFGLVEGMSLKEQLKAHLHDPDARWDVLALGHSLHVLPSESGAANPAALLGSEAMPALVNELRQEFDYVLMTPPPILEVADAAILEDLVDGTLLVVAAGTSRLDEVKASLQRLSEERVLGTVLTDVPSPKRSKSSG